MQENVPSSQIPRRHFLQTGMLGATAFAASTLPIQSEAAVTKCDCDPFHNLKVGLTSYTLRKFDLDAAIAMTKQAGVQYISLKEVHLPLKSTRERRQEVRKKLEQAGLILMGGGVIYMKNNEQEILNVFDYARDSGMKTIVCSPELEALDTIERRAREYDIRIAIHNHGPGDNRYPSPLDVMRLVKDRNAHMGVCMDVGHTVRLNQDPVAAIRACSRRLYEFHMKDVTAAQASGKATEVGKGVIDIVAVLKALVRMKWPYHVALEYEAATDNPMPGMLESFAYIRGVCSAFGPATVAGK